MAIAIPQPKAELVVRRQLREDGSIAFLEIFPYSLAAHAWIQAEAPKFGSLTDPSTSEYRHGERTLFVHPVYDMEEVAAYLESMDTEDAPEVQE